MAELYDKYMINFSETDFQSDCTILHLHQQCIRVLAAPHSHQHLVWSVFLTSAIVLGYSIISL